MKDTGDYEIKSVACRARYSITENTDIMVMFSVMLPAYDTAFAMSFYQALYSKLSGWSTKDD